MSRQRGFTVVEITVVVLIVGLVAVIALSTLRRAPEKTARHTCAEDKNTLVIAIASYRARYGSTTDPTRSDLKQTGLLGSLDNAYTYTYLDHTPQFLAVVGTGCR